jgi:four helix bundle protein
MARDHRKLRVFHNAHKLVLAVYRLTHCFPQHEWYALRQQVRRAATSIPSNIVEGSARRTTKEYVHFLGTWSIWRRSCATFQARRSRN